MRRALLLTSLLAYAGHCFSADDLTAKQVEPAVNQRGEPWVLVVTYLVSPGAGGSVGAAFQEFSSKQRCEAAIQHVATQSKKHDNGWGKADRLPVTQCIPK